MAGEVMTTKTYWGLESKPCDSCKTSPSILFCRADSAFLCTACDARVHSANKLASRHERVWLCEVCEQAPAAVTCKADAAALCVSCDADIHSANPLARRHDRHPVSPFFESNEAVKKLGFKKCGFEEEEEVDLKSADYFFSDVDPYLDLEYADSVVPVGMGGGGGGQVVGVPTSHAVQQSGFEFEFPTNNPSYSTYSVCSSEEGDVSNGYQSAISGNIQTGAVSVLDREAKVMRYREKRKNRKFEKTIRYASRKAYAETRPRIKGRFAKRTEVETDMERVVYSSVGMVDGGYGVVPSF